MRTAPLSIIRIDGHPETELYTPADADGLIRALADELRRASGGELAARLRLGAALARVHGVMQHGQWGPYLERVSGMVGLSVRVLRRAHLTAQRLADRQGEIDGAKVRAACQTKLRDASKHLPKLAPVEAHFGVRSGLENDGDGVGEVVGETERRLRAIAADPAAMSIRDAEALVGQRPLGSRVGRVGRGGRGEGRGGARGEQLTLDSLYSAARREVWRVVGDRPDLAAAVDRLVERFCAEFADAVRALAGAQ